MVYCGTCHKILTDQKEVPATGHTKSLIKPWRANLYRRWKNRRENTVLSAERSPRFQKVILQPAMTGKRGRNPSRSNLHRGRREGLHLYKMPGNQNRKNPCPGSCRGSDRASPTPLQRGRKNSRNPLFCMQRNYKKRRKKFRQPVIKK